MFWAPASLSARLLTRKASRRPPSPPCQTMATRRRQSSLSNPFPNGLDRPVGNSLGALTGIGKSVTIFDPNAKSTRVQQFSFDVQYQINSSSRGDGWLLRFAHLGSDMDHGELQLQSAEPELLEPGRCL